MKVYFIDKYNKHLDIKKDLEDAGIQNIELKEDLNYRINKTDYVITFDLEFGNEEYAKVNNLIAVVNNTEKNSIWNIANKLNTKDIILNQKDKNYMVQRIQKVINQ